MKHSDKPWEELELAEAAIQAIIKADGFRDVELAWKRFLHHIDRCWNKAEAHFHRSPKWVGWSGKYVALRRRDELLSYLIAARNADEHTVAELARHEPGHLAISPAIPGGDVYIRNLTIENGVIQNMDIPTPYLLDIQAPRIHLLPVESRTRQIYKVPTRHVGKAISSDAPADVSALGYLFYREFLIAADSHFVTED